jgi:O-antigen biosynthesis protein
MKSMGNTKLVCMYRVKNEEKWIKKSIESIYDLCDEIVVLDDDSSDNTVEICSSFDKVKEIKTQRDLPLDEVRDRNLLLQMALKRKPDVILSVDGDEIFMPNSAEILHEELNVLYPESNVFEFQFLTLWDSSAQIRCDGIFGHYWQKRLFRTKNQPLDLRFEENSTPGNLHCGSVPPNTIEFDNPIRSTVKIFHLASLDSEIRQKKYDYYAETDPESALTDGYKHMISGEGKFSGPKGIELQQLPNKFALMI